MPQIFKSVTVILLFLVVGAYVSVCVFYPWRDLAAREMPAWVVRLVARIPEYVYGPEKKQIVVLGSSLIIAPPDGAVYEMDNAQDTGWENSIRHRAARYTKLIEEKTGANFPLEILASPAAMISDQCCILRELKRSNKMPRLLVFTVAPRDFIDNQVGDGLEHTWIKEIFSLRSRNSLIPADWSPEALSACIKSNSTFVDVIRRQTANNLKTKFTASILKKEEKLARPSAQKNNLSAEQRQPNAIKAAAKSTKMQPETETAKASRAFAQTLVDYRQRYQPPNQKRFLTQMDFFQEMLELAKAAEAKVVIVEMPLTQENLALLKPTQRADYQSNLAALATKYGAELIDFNQTDLIHFNRSDFDDCVHLSFQGGEKFIPAFADVLTKSAAFKNAFLKH